MMQLNNSDQKQHNAIPNRFFVRMIRQRAKEIGDTLSTTMTPWRPLHKQQQAKRRQPTISQQNYAEEEQQLRVWFEQEQLRLAQQESIVQQELNRTTTVAATATKRVSTSQSTPQMNVTGPNNSTQTQKQLDKIVARLKQVRSNNENKMNEAGIAHLRAAVVVS